MGVDCYLAKKKRETADIEFVQLDRLYYFNGLDGLNSLVLHPVDQFKDKVEELKKDQQKDSRTGLQTYWLNQVLNNLKDCDFAGIVSEFEYESYHNCQTEIRTA